MWNVERISRIETKDTILPLTDLKNYHNSSHVLHIQKNYQSSTSLIQFIFPLYSNWLVIIPIKKKLLLNTKIVCVVHWITKIWGSMLKLLWGNICFFMINSTKIVNSQNKIISAERIYHSKDVKSTYYW